TQRYPELVTELAGLDCQRAVLDGEIVAPDASGRPSFALLQPRINLSRPADIAAAARQTPIRLMLFDVLSLDGQPLVGEAYENRRHVLERLVAVHSGNGVQAPPAFDGDLAAALEASSAFGLEGVVAKRMGSPYQSGRRGRAWLKIKHRRSQAVVVGGWNSGQGHRAGTLGSLLLGIPSSDGLRFVGKAGSGFTDAALVQAHRALEPLARSTTPFVEVTGRDAQNAHWVEPTLVGEVYYTEATSAGRLRHPVWKGWRPDVPPSTVVWE
ncbi:MAG: ATP-dependent DNA ligase, partial [Propionicimonas sp.]